MRRPTAMQACAAAAGMQACGACLARAGLLCALAGHLDRERARIQELLALPDLELVAAVAGAHRTRFERELEEFDAVAAIDRLRRADVSALCRCAPGYPARLRQLSAAPAVMHVAGELDVLRAACGTDPVAIVGSRRASAYGVELARSLARSLAVAGVPVISGMAAGIDCAAHEGALAASGLTVAVLAGEPQRAYPVSARALHRRLLASGAVVSELPPGALTRRWMFPARNRVIAALASMTVVVEAGARSGALITAAIARTLGRPVGAIPGRVTSPLAAGCHALLRDGARLVEGPEDVLEALFGSDAVALARDTRPALDDAHRELLEMIAAGIDPSAVLAGGGGGPGKDLAAVAWLELAGYLRREAGGRWAVVP